MRKSNNLPRGHNILPLLIIALLSVFAFILKSINEDKTPVDLTVYDGPEFVEFVENGNFPVIYSFQDQDEFQNFIVNLGHTGPIKNGAKVTQMADGELIVERMHPKQLVSLGIKIPINSASRDELTGIPHIGPVLADRIVQFRRSKGGFSNIDELLMVKGIGEKKIADIARVISFED